MSEYIPTSTWFISVSQNDREIMEFSSKNLQCKCTNDTILFEKNGRYCTKISRYCKFCTNAHFYAFFQHGLRFANMECRINVALQYFSSSVVFWRARFYFCLIIVFPTTNKHSFFWFSHYAQRWRRLA